MLMRKFVLCLVTALLCLASVFAQKVESEFIDAVALYSSGKIEQAERKLENLSRTAPDDDAVWYYLGRCRIARKDFSSARGCLEKAIELDGKNYWYRSTLASLYMVQDETRLAIEMYEALVRDFPGKENLSYDLLELYIREKEYDKAMDTISAIQRQNGLTEQLVQLRYELLMQQGKADEALKGLEEFREEYSSPRILSLLGDHYLTDYADSAARASYAEALELDGSYPPALLGMSEVYRRERDYPGYFSVIGKFLDGEDTPPATKAVYIRNLARSLDPKILQRQREGFDSLVSGTLGKHPSDSSILTAAAAYYYGTGRTEEAGAYFREASEKYPESMSLAAACLQYYALMQDWEKVRDLAVEGFGRFKNIGFLDYANQADFLLEDYDAVLGNCQWIINNFPKDKDLLKTAWMLKGDAYHAKGERRQAYSAYEKALKLDPDLVPVLNNYAYYLAEDGKCLKKAYKMSRKTIEAEPDNATYLDTFAWILHLQGKDLEAKPFFKHAMLYGGKDSAVILDHYADVLYSLGEYDLARSYWNQARLKNKDGEVPDLEQRIAKRLAALEK